tara:strand:+ start:53 stop:409 length:357 start_codon:yes stop_codon:yes gene_type:complete
MKEVKHKRIDNYNHNEVDDKVIQDFMEDDRGKVDYTELGELIKVMEVIADTLPVDFSMSSHGWSIKHKYQVFHESYMWYNSITRTAALYIVIVRFLNWWNKEDRKIIDAHYKWLKETK